MPDKTGPLQQGVDKPKTDNPIPGNPATAPDDQGKDIVERVEKQDVSNESNEVASGTADE